MYANKSTTLNFPDTLSATFRSDKHLKIPAKTAEKLTI
jgi:hypothetical protein